MNQNLMDFDIGADKLREECGVFGMYDFDGNDAVSYTHLDVYKRQDIPGRLYLQAANIQKDSSRTGNRRYSSGCEPPLRQIRLHTLHQLGTQRAFCFQLRGRHQGKGLGPCAEPRVHQEAQ